ncbi:hypothetical protein OROMI_025404 [Orobanche minor]
MVVVRTARQRRLQRTAVAADAKGFLETRLAHIEDIQDWVRSNKAARSGFLDASDVVVKWGWFIGFTDLLRDSTCPFFFLSGKCFDCAANKKVMAHGLGTDLRTRLSGSSLRNCSLLIAYILTLSIGPTCRSFIMTAKERCDATEKTIGEFQDTITGQGANISGLVQTVSDMGQKLDFVIKKLEGLGSAGSQPLMPCPAVVDVSFSYGVQQIPNTVGGMPLGWGQPSASLSPSVKLSKMELPAFDGPDPIAWLAQAEQFFLVHNRPLCDRVKLGLIAMSGRAMFWAQWALRRDAAITWPQFSIDLIQRFGDSFVRKTRINVTIKNAETSFDKFPSFQLHFEVTDE